MQRNQEAGRWGARRQGPCHGSFGTMVNPVPFHEINGNNNKNLLRLDYTLVYYGMGQFLFRVYYGLRGYELAYRP